ncbi:MAG TPA: hypothetical protein VD867_02535, partial [Burkholderiales bacterium]|nr:hypothetical protein [Burkholderiales bacterium]
MKQPAHHDVPALPADLSNRMRLHRISRDAPCLEDSVDMWRAQCLRWTSVAVGAHLAEDSHREAEAHLNLSMCERERARIEVIAGRISDGHALLAHQLKAFSTVL